MWLDGRLCLSTCEHLRFIIFYNLVGQVVYMEFHFNSTQISKLNLNVWSVNESSHFIQGAHII